VCFGMGVHVYEAALGSIHEVLDDTVEGRQESFGSREGVRSVRL